MHQWLGLMIGAHKAKFDAVAKSYLNKKGLTMAEWLKGIKKGVRADTMALHMLYALTDTHTVVYLSNGRYWSMQRDEPTEHSVYLERCNTHLCYLGNGKFAELELKLEPYEFEIFGIDQPNEVELETCPMTLGSLSADEVKTLDILCKRGISTHSRAPPSATAGSSKDLPCVIQKLKTEPVEPVMASNQVELAAETHDDQPTTLTMTTDTVVMASNLPETMNKPDSEQHEHSQSKTAETSTNLMPVVRVEKVMVTTDTVILSKKKPPTTPKVESLLKLHKLTEQEINRAKKLLIKKKPKAKIKVTTPVVKVKARFSIASHGVKKCKHKYNYKCKV